MPSINTGQVRPKRTSGGGSRLRVVLDSTPTIGTPVTRVEHNIPFLGWRQLEGTPARLAGSNAWKCSIEAADQDHDYRYDVEFSDVESLEVLDKTLRSYAKDLLDGIDSSKVSKLLITAVPVS